MDFATRLEQIEPSAPMAISTLASELEAEGADVVDLSVGEPDFPTPERIVAAGRDAMSAGHTGYTPTNGIPELRDAVAEKFRTDGLDCDSDDVIVTPGAKHAIYETIQALVDEGDEVVLLDPAWVSYEAMVELAEGDLTRLDLSPYDFRLEPALDELAATVSDETALLVVNTPNNPTGTVYSESALEGVRDLAVAHDVTVLSDEIYRDIAYDTVPRSLGALDGMEGRTVTVNGFSKSYSMTGWRLGYMTAASDVISRVERVQSHSVSCASNFVQRAGVEALRNTTDSLQTMVAAFEDRRDLLVDLLDEHGTDISTPRGAFYVMIPVDSDDEQWCKSALTEAHVATVPGSAFGTPGYARISYANGTSRIRDAVTRLSETGYL